MPLSRIITDNSGLPSKFVQFVILFFYVISGVLQPTLIEVLTYNGACERTTFLFILPNYIGMGLSVLTNMQSLQYGRIRWARLSALLLIDLCSAVLCFTGLVYAGSAIFTVIYSSVTVYTAVFSWLLFGRQLHYMQWTGVFLVMLGLISSSFGGASKAGSDDVSNDEGVGILMIIIGAGFHSLSYIIAESILKDTDAIAPEVLGSSMGLFGCIIFGCWQIFYTLPRFQRLIIDEIAAHNGNYNIIIITYICLITVNFIHGICFFYMLKIVGSTTTGILKGIQSVLVFIISHFAFCGLQESQCFTVAKGLALIVVVLGVFCYSSYKLEEMPSRPLKKDLLSNASEIFKIELDERIPLTSGKRRSSNDKRPVGVRSRGNGVPGISNELNSSGGYGSISATVSEDSHHNSDPLGPLISPENEQIVREYAERLNITLPTTFQQKSINSTGFGDYSGIIGQPNTILDMQTIHPQPFVSSGVAGGGPGFGSGVISNPESKSNTSQEVKEKPHWNPNFELENL